MVTALAPLLIDSINQLLAVLSFRNYPPFTLTFALVSRWLVVSWLVKPWPGRALSNHIENLKLVS